MTQVDAKNDSGSRARRVAGWAALAWALVIAVATLRPGVSPSVSPILWCLRCGELGGRDVALNVLAFAPLGFLLAIATGRPPVAALAALALSLLVEGAQATVVPGRDPSLSDLLTNTIGGAIGAWTAAGVDTLIFPRPRAARVLAAVAAVAWLGLMWLSAQAMRRSTGAPEYWGQWAHRWPKLQPFLGRVYTFTVDGAPVPDDRVARPGTIRAMSVGDSVEVATIARPAAPTSGLAPIVSVSNESRGTIFLLGQDHQDLVFHMRTHAADAGFAALRLRVSDVFPACAALCDSARTLSLRAVVTPGAVTLSATTPAGPVATRRVDLDPLLAWSAVAPGRTTITSRNGLAGALLCALLLAVTGYWWGWLPAAAARRAPVLGTLVAVVATGLTFPALLAGLSLPGPAAWLVCVAGAGAGFAASARTRGTRAQLASPDVIRRPAA